MFGRACPSLPYSYHMMTTRRLPLSPTMLVLVWGGWGWGEGGAMFGRACPSLPYSYDMMTTRRLPLSPTMLVLVWGGWG
jgi:hypothetical protein